MLNIREYVDIKDYSSLRVGGQFRYFVEVLSKDDLLEACKWAKGRSLRIFILGGGSNIVFPDGVFEVLAIKMNIFGFRIVSDEHNHIDINIGAGEDWDSVVERSVGMNLSGIEALSAIPGKAGATPVQNIGAYGQEIKDTLISIEVFNIEKGIFEFLSKFECKFGYRDSIFKMEPPRGIKGKLIIISINLRLRKSPAGIPKYPGFEKYFEDKHITKPDVREIREAIISIRKSKLPNPKEIPNVGSFFKNPIIESELLDIIKKRYPSIVTFPIDSDYVKVPAGWLIEQAGLKGKDFGNISVYTENALVLVNNGGASRVDIERVSGMIIQTVYEKFGIKLETEPEFA